VVRSSRIRCRSYWAWALRASALAFLQVGRRRGVLLRQVLGARQRLLRQIALRLELRDLRPQLGIVHLEERRPLVDLLSLADQDLDDAPVDLGAQVDGLHGFDLARRADLVSKRCPCGRPRLPPACPWVRPTPTRGIRTAGLALAASARCDRECRDYPKPFTCLDHVRSPLFLFGKEPLAEDCFEPGEGQFASRTAPAPGRIPRRRDRPAP